MFSMESTEKRFEQDIESWLITFGGWQQQIFQEISFDSSKGLSVDKLISYINRTQPKQWARYTRIYGNQDAKEMFYKRFEEAVTSHGILHMLRNGFKDRGVKFKVITFQPVSGLNHELEADYQANEFSCVRQFAYSPNNRNTIDMILMVNGIPLVSIELKNKFTGQDIEDAKLQYKKDRDPKEKVFGFNHRFLVYFAADSEEVWMTTALKGFDTHFLPFNQGSGGAGKVGTKGNPANYDGYSTEYLWKNVLQKDKLMDIFNRFMNLEVKEETRSGKTRIKRTLIFPRYHQLDVVNKLVGDVKRVGSGAHYLIQHSAGSGKSNSIAWLAYHLSNLHDEENNPIFASIVIVTDRTVLDRQLQNTITSFDHKTGFVETIGDNKTSKDLRDAINDGKRIIITTLQKFPIIYKEVDDAKHKKFAVIVDEAHSSQTGKASMKLKQALANKEEALKEWQEFDESVENETLDSQDQLVQTIISQGRHNNLSFFAFTATPKQKTLEMFGTRQDDGSFRAFHIYSMMQAIDEGFILDVLANYMTYHTAYKIAKEIPDDPELPESGAKRAIRRYQSLHPYNLRQKTEIMIETFRERTIHQIGGRAKAMLVTPSRLHAVRYLREFKKYIEEKSYTDLDVLVAFSGEVTDGDEKYTEEKLNTRNDGTRIKEKQLKEAFSGSEYNILVVAEKYQTGFDEPLLHTMFVDKKLRGVKAVQTLSRLNRTTSGKTDTFVLDFENKAEDIKEAFQPFYEATMLDKAININMIYDAQERIRKYNLYNSDDVDKVIALYMREAAKQDHQDLGRLASAFAPVITRYKQLDVGEQYEYRVLLRGFQKMYNYITQLTSLFDRELLEESIFIEHLIRFIPKTQNEKFSISDKVRLEYYKLHQDFEGQVSLVRESGSYLTNQSSINADQRVPEPKESLEIILSKINAQFEGQLTEDDRVIMEMVGRKLVDKPTEKQRSLARNNSWEMFRDSLFKKVFIDEMIRMSSESQKSFEKIFTNQEMFDALESLVAAEAYKTWRADV